MMKKVQWIKVHGLADVVRANVQEETELGTTGSDITVPLSALPEAVAEGVRAAIDALTAHLNEKAVVIDAAKAAEALGAYTGVPLVPRAEMDVALAEQEAKFAAPSA